MSLRGYVRMSIGQPTVDAFASLGAQAEKNVWDGWWSRKTRVCVCVCGGGYRPLRSPFAYFHQHSLLLTTNHREEWKKTLADGVERVIWSFETRGYLSGVSCNMQHSLRDRVGMLWYAKWTLSLWADGWITLDRVLSNNRNSMREKAGNMTLSIGLASYHHHHHHHHQQQQQKCNFTPTRDFSIFDREMASFFPSFGLSLECAHMYNIISSLFRVIEAPNSVYIFIHHQARSLWKNRVKFPFPSFIIRVTYWKMHISLSLSFILSLALLITFSEQLFVASPEIRSLQRTAERRLRSA